MVSALMPVLSDRKKTGTAAADGDSSATVTLTPSAADSALD